MLMNILKDFFINGKLPFNRKYISWLSFYILPVLMLAYGLIEGWDGYAELGEKGWLVLLIVMFMSPIRVLFSKVGLLRLACSFRKEASVLCFWMLLYHSLGLMYLKDLFVWSNFVEILDVNSAIFWGLISFVGIFLLGITSNNYSMVLLKKWWRRLHLLAYPTFIAGGLHIALLKPEKRLQLIIVLTVYLLLKAIVVVKKRCFKKK